MPTRRRLGRFNRDATRTRVRVARDQVEPHRAAQQVLELAETAPPGGHPSGTESDDYRSPEEATGAPRSPAGDVFSLGLLLYELLTGRSRFEGSSPWGAPAHRLFSTAADTEALLPSTPSALRNIVARALARDPSERYPDVPALADALRQWLAKEAPPASGSGRPSSREAVILILALLVIGFLAVRSASWLGLMEGASPEPTPEVAVQGAGRSPTGIGSPPASPMRPEVGVTRTPRGTVIAFYRRVERDAYERAHALFSDALRDQVSPQQLAERYRDTMSITVESVQIARAAGVARVAVEVLEVTTSGESRRLRGWWELVLDDGEWALHQPSF